MDDIKSFLKRRVKGESDYYLSQLVIPNFDRA